MCSTKQNAFNIVAKNNAAFKVKMVSEYVLNVSDTGIANKFVMPEFSEIYYDIETYNVDKNFGSVPKECDNTSKVGII